METPKNFHLPPLPADLILPPLPTITAPTVEELVFTHFTFHKLPRRPAHFDIEEVHMSRDYEKFELIGDGVLRNFIIVKLHELFPGLPVGSTNFLKKHLIDDKTLSQLSTRYNLPDKLRISTHLDPIVIDQSSIEAALFKAYIGGLFLAYQKDGKDGTKGSSGAAQDWVYEWLSPLFEPIAKWTLDLVLDRIKLDDPEEHRGMN